jgi:predicted acyl esterase
MATLALRSARSFRCSSTFALLGSLASCACSGSDRDDSEASAPSTLRTELHGSSLSQPEYSAEELQALDEDPALEASKLPFAPPPDPDESRYVTASDGTRLALSFYFPAGFARNTDQAPVAYIETWYGRGAEAQGTPIELYRSAGFIVVIGDPRGFGASFGSQPSLLDDAVRENQLDIVRWLAVQPWSSGKVVSVGWSASCNAVDALAGSQVESLAGAIARAPDFDHHDYKLFPGGVPNTGIPSLGADGSSLTLPLKPWS